MESLSSDLLYNISLHLSVIDIIRFCTVSHLMHNFQSSLLAHKQADVESAKNIARFCRICNYTIRKGFRCLVVCTCIGTNNYPYFHTDCLHLQNLTKSCILQRCPLCNVKKNFILGLDDHNS